MEIPVQSDTGERQHRSRTVQRTIRLDRQTRPYERGRSGLTGARPRIPRALGLEEAEPATRRRRWLLAIFGQMMARFYEGHARRLSAGRWACSICQRRIVAWAWCADAQPAPEIVHEDCVSRSVWEMVLYYDYLGRSGYVPATPSE